MACEAIDAIESMSIMETVDFLDTAEMLLSLDITDRVSSIPLSIPPGPLLPAEMTEASTSKRSFASICEPTRDGLYFCKASLICYILP